MLRHSKIEKICCLVLAATLFLTCGMLGISAIAQDTGHTMGYENRLFDQSRVHTIDILIDDWAAFLAQCTSEEYTACDVMIDGESFKNVAIRGKGNTSLTTVESYGNDRYSFKIEFDHYDGAFSYHGLDKLSLNNVIQDNTYMKDYLAYSMMGKMGVAAPLCSFVQVNVNGEAWGLYLAVECVEDAFLERNYGSTYGELYKPDSQSFGGGRGNGMGFDMASFTEASETQIRGVVGGFGGQIPPGQAGGMKMDRDEQGGVPAPDMGGMGSADVKLQYINDDPDSYGNIFDNAKTDITQADQQRLIESLKRLSEGDTEVVDRQQVAMYMAVHNFLCNGDSYTGSMIHNYYLYEEDGVMAMIPWDYNLAFGGFQGGSDATGLVNSPIDTLVSSGSGDRPMADWITASEENLQLYHEAYAETVEILYDSGWIGEEIERVKNMIAPYVEEDPTKFCSYEEFVTGAEMLKIFCEKRFESVKGQLNGDIPSTQETQTNRDAFVDASGITVSDMGGMNMNGGRNVFGGNQNFGGMTLPEGMEMPGSMMPPEGMEVPDGNITPPDGTRVADEPSTETETQDTEERAESETGSSDWGNAQSGKTRAGRDMNFSNAFSADDRSGTQTWNQWIILGVCAAVLLAGIVVAGIFKGRY